MTDNEWYSSQENARRLLAHCIDMSLGEPVGRLPLVLMLRSTSHLTVNVHLCSFQLIDTASDLHCHRAISSIIDTNFSLSLLVCAEVDVRLDMLLWFLLLAAKYLFIAHTLTLTAAQTHTVDQLKQLKLITVQYARVAAGQSRPVRMRDKS